MVAPMDSFLTAVTDCTVTKAREPEPEHGSSRARRRRVHKPVGSHPSASIYLHADADVKTGEAPLTSPAFPSTSRPVVANVEQAFAKATTPLNN